MKFNLIQYSILLIVVLVTAFVITPVFRSIARKLKILDKNYTDQSMPIFNFLN